MNLREEILRILNENYVLRPTGYTEQDCMAHDILALVAEAVEKVGLTPGQIDLIIESHRVVDYPPDIATHIAKAQLQKALAVIKG